MTPHPLIINWQGTQPDFAEAAGIHTGKIAILRNRAYRLSNHQILRCKDALMADWRDLAVADRSQWEAVR
jgi:hypothetical protein